MGQARMDDSAPERERIRTEGDEEGEAVGEDEEGGMARMNRGPKDWPVEGGEEEEQKEWKEKGTDRGSGKKK